MDEAPKFSEATVTPWSSVVGSSIALHARGGEVVGQLSVRCFIFPNGDYKGATIGLAEKIAELINAYVVRDP